MADRRFHYASALKHQLSARGGHSGEDRLLRNVVVGAHFMDSLIATHTGAHCVRVSTQNGDRAAGLQISSIVLLCETLTEDGHGLLPLSLLHAARQGMAQILGGGCATDTCQYPPALIEKLNEIVNAYDRQMRETRLHAIVAASDKVNRMLVAKKRNSGTDESEVHGSDVRDGS